MELINTKQFTFNDPYYAAADRELQLDSESGKVTFIHDLQLKNSPLIGRSCEFSWERGLDTTKMILDTLPNNFKLYQELRIPGWKIRGIHTLQGIIHYDTDFGERRLKGNSSISRITYQLQLQRESWSFF